MPTRDFFSHSLISYAEFPPLVAPILSKKSTAKRKKAGGFMHHKDTNTDIVAPILRPEIVGNTKDQELYQKITKKLGVDPKLRDDESYMQFMNYNQFAYFEIVPMSPYLLSLQAQQNNNALPTKVRT